ncbi:DUF2284 domain-containing protein [Prevotella sp. HUN102]|uniref:DUF2284 domain-containing protein n=1 Tax=Prevotella sp. HUN102 TaxID=1392486 RepID=UPI00048AF5CB|nr:DUF2284 domain-containing protein [Prevotella sp. HUN102]
MSTREITSIGEAKDKGFSLSNIATTIPVKEYADGYRDIEKFLGLCKQCPRFGKSWTCPPCEFDVTEYVEQFKYAHILSMKMTFDEETMNKTNTAEDVRTVCDEAMKFSLTKASAYLRKYERKYPGSICFLGSRCLLCGSKPCARLENKPCRHPKDVRVSLEAVGFDLGKTSQDLLGIEMKWGKPDRLPEYITLITALLTNDENLVLT